MPTATAFKYPRSFPYCPTSTSPGATWDYVGALTLTEAMAFWWNIADITITTAGTSTVGANTANAAGSVNFNSPARSGDFINNTTWSASDCALFFENTPGAFSSLASATRTPVERICSDSIGFLILSVVDDGTADLYKIHLCELGFYVKIDPSNSSKFAIYYRFIIRAGDYNNANVSFSNPAYGQQSTSNTYTTGTFDIGGHTFDWRCYYNTSLSGENMSVSTSTFTY